MLTANIVFAQKCYESTILSPSPFMGNDAEIFKLADGSIWEVKYEYEYLYEYYPKVIICPSQRKLGINGKMLDVELIKAGKSTSLKSDTIETPTQDIIETQIDGDFDGWEGETIIKLINGQIWQQIEYYYEYSYAYMPDVLIYKTGSRYKMKVDGIDESVEVSRLK